MKLVVILKPTRALPQKWMCPPKKGNLIKELLKSSDTFKKTNTNEMSATTCNYLLAASLEQVDVSLPPRNLLKTSI